MGNSVMRSFVHPYGINVNSSNGFDDATGLCGASAADPSFISHSGSLRPRTVARTGGWSAEKGQPPTGASANLTSSSNVA
jgi:hypothetical protein